MEGEDQPDAGKALQAFKPGHEFGKDLHTAGEVCGVDGLTGRLGRIGMGGVDDADGAAGEQGQRHGLLL